MIKISEHIFSVAFSEGHFLILTEMSMNCDPAKMFRQHCLKPLSHSAAILRRWHGDLKFLRAPWDRTKILKNVANDFIFSINVEMSRRAHGDSGVSGERPQRAAALPRSSDRRLTA